MSVEVRRCTRCDRAAAVCVHELISGGEVLGFSTDSSRVDRRVFRCQDCGARFVLRSRSAAWTLVVMSGLFLAAVTGLEIYVAATFAPSPDAGWLLLVFAPFQLAFAIVIAVGVRRLRAWRRHQVVDGAAPPAITFPEIEDAIVLRRCAACAGTASLVSTTHHRWSALPAGTEWTYACAQCRERFTLSSPWRAANPPVVVMSALIGLAWWRAVPGGVGPQATAIGLAIVAFVTWRVVAARRARARHAPVLASATIIKDAPPGSSSRA